LVNEKENFSKDSINIIFNNNNLLYLFEYFKKDKNELSKPINPSSKIEEEAVYNSNIIKDINYTSRDLKGNEYILIAKEGEIDLDNSDIIFLTDVTAYIKLVKNSELIVITSIMANITP
jgi:hypothetical protein